MSPQTQHCDECKHFLLSRIHLSPSKEKSCNVGHRPKYYKPECSGSDFGYKRRCEDFEHYDPNSKSAALHRLRALNGDD